MSGSRLDRVYRSILQTRFFNKGWGKPENLKRLFEFRKTVSNRETCFPLVSEDYPVTITKEEEYSDYRILEGKFLSPFVIYQKGMLPPEAETAYFQAVLPKKWNSDHYRPVCLQLAGTGDHGFWRRRKIVAQPLLKEGGISSIILENPFYGLRKPKDQVRSCLHNVSDIFVMGGCLILESLALFHWCERNGLGPLGVTGLSMGGHMASLAATSWPKPLVLVPCLSWSTASPVFTQGVMSSSIDWKLLQSQYISNETLNAEIMQMVQLNQDAFKAGQHFAKHYPESLERIKELKLESHKNKNEVELNKDNDTKQIHGTSSLNVVNQRQCDTPSRNTDASRNQQMSEIRIQENSSTNVNNTVSRGESQQTVCSINIPSDNKTDSVEKSESNFLTIDLLKKSNPMSLVSHINESKSKFLDFRFMSNNKSKSVDTSTQLTKTDSVDEAMLKKWRENETLEFMRGIMDECTHLKNFSTPVDTSLIIAVCAKNDAYVPRQGCAALTDIWPGSEVRFLNAGHVSAYLFHQHTFRQAIIESFERLKNKYFTS